MKDLRMVKPMRQSITVATLQILNLVPRYSSSPQRTVITPLLVSFQDTIASRPQ